MESDVRTLRALLRRLKFCAPAARTAGASGVNPHSFELAAQAEGLIVSADPPDLWIAWCPGEQVDAESLPPNLLAAAVVAQSLRNSPPGLPPAQPRPATAYSTLRQWVANWPLAALLSPLLAPDAVGARSCKVRLGDNLEWIFSIHAAKQAASGDLREAAVTVFGIGYFPIMPATLVCLLMLPPALLLRASLGGGIFLFAALALCLLATCLGVTLEKWAASHFLAGDPREFVLDEVAGLSLAWACLPPSAPLWSLVLVFFLFRFFDIFKFGIAWIEKFPFPGTVTWDDLLAGFYAGFSGLLLIKMIY